MGKDHELLEAARNGNVTVIEKLLLNRAKRSGPLASLRRGPGTNAQDSCGYSALHHAALNGHTEIVNLLLSNDASPNLPDSRGSSSLHLAAWAGHHEIVDILLTNAFRPANPNLQTIDKETPLHCAAQHGHTESLTILLIHGADPNVKNAKNETPLDLAAQYGRFQVVQILINGHPELLLPFKFGKTVDHSPLHLASRNGHTHIVELLLSSGVDVNSQTQSGTALHEAALCGKDNVVLTLLEAGANLDAVDSEGRTVLVLLQQFPAHVTRGIVSVIKNHKNSRNSKTYSIENKECNIDSFEHLNLSKFKRNFNIDNNLHNQNQQCQHHDDNTWCKDSCNKDCFNSTLKSKSFSSSIDNNPNLYIAMAPIDLNKHTPPKKPPRRNYSLSPTYLQGNHRMSMSLDISDDKQYSNKKDNKSAYEYLFLSRTGYDIEKNDQQYIQMKSPNQSPVSQNHIFYENLTTGMRIFNPNRKLKRNKNRSSCGSFGNGGGIYDEFLKASKAQLPSSASYIVLNNNGKENNTLIHTPISPTHYNQPPTPEHPPPTPNQAESFIHEIIRPLSQEYQRRSRELTETGTSPTNNLCTSLGASSASLSSSISLSDRSVSTDCVEEFVGDVPFAGLFKGSTPNALYSTSSGTTASIPDPTIMLSRLERPKTLKTVNYSKNNCSNSNNHITLTNETNQTSDSKPISILSPFDEQEEWTKISEIMASFGEGLFIDSDNDIDVKLFKKLSSSKSLLSMQSLKQLTIEKWLETIELDHLCNIFIENGFDDVDFLNGILNEDDLKQFHLDENDVPIVLESLKLLPKPKSLDLTVEFGSYVENNNIANITMEQWLESIKLGCYIETFRKHLYTDMERIVKIWETELQTVLEINTLGHRKRIIYSIYGNNKPNNCRNDKIEPIDPPLQRVNKIQENYNSMEKNDYMSSDGGILNISNHNQRNNRKKNRPAPKPPIRDALPNLEIRAPAELLLGFPTGLKTQWRHSADTFISSFVKYRAYYLGSTVVKELRGTESTRKSIQKLKRGERVTTNQHNNASIISQSIKRPICLAISFCGVQFIDIETQSIICEHEIKNIDCACQDADDLTHFAYITKDVDTHYCHVFNVDSMDLATEIILTLGQAFEVAYQLALRELSPSTPHRGSVDLDAASAVDRVKPSLVL